jgi:hypothetical protein
MKARALRKRLEYYKSLRAQQARVIAELTRENDQLRQKLGMIKGKWRMLTGTIPVAYMPFGRYMNNPLEHIPRSYLTWCLENCFDSRSKHPNKQATKKLKVAIERELERRESEDKELEKLRRQQRS